MMSERILEVVHSFDSEDVKIDSMVHRPLNKLTISPFLEAGRGHFAYDLKFSEDVNLCMEHISWEKKKNGGDQDLELSVTVMKEDDRRVVAQLVNGLCLPGKENKVTFPNAFSWNLLVSENFLRFEFKKDENVRSTVGIMGMFYMIAD